MKREVEFIPDPRPTCPCGNRKQQCPACETWWCAAPGHTKHRCPGEEG